MSPTTPLSPAFFVHTLPYLYLVAGIKNRRGVRGGFKRPTPSLKAGVSYLINVAVTTYQLLFGQHLQQQCRRYECHAMLFSFDIVQRQRAPKWDVWGV